MTEIATVMSLHLPYKSVWKAARPQKRSCPSYIRAYVSKFYCSYKQGRREPNVRPGPAQILSISGFVYSKTEAENATGFSGF